MATFYLDLTGGSDAGAGTAFGTRWLTFASGATAARTAPGDTIRVMASPEPTLVGSATWTQYSKTVTLASAVTQTVADCETAWTASANVTASTSTTRKQGSNSAQLVIAAGFTTGLVAYFATGTLDLSAYQQLSMWVRGGANHVAGVFEIKFCSDTVGAVPVNTFSLGAISSTNWGVQTVDLATALGSSIQSVALYAVSDPGTVTMYLDCILACKAASSADSLTLTSLIGKADNLNWVASTSYSTGDIRKPTPPNRNGFRYTATTGGTTAGSEPTWPLDYGLTVTDGSVVWTCTSLEETWLPIQSISGTTVLIDNEPNTLASAGGGYSGASGTIATYKREPLLIIVGATLAEAGTLGLPITYSGGWNRTDMSTQTGETWVATRSSNVNFLGGARQYITLDNISGARYTSLFNSCATTGSLIKNCHAVACASYGHYSLTECTPITITGCNFSNNFRNLRTDIDTEYQLSRISLQGATNAGFTGPPATNYFKVIGNYLDVTNNATYGMALVHQSGVTLANVVSANNSLAGIHVTAGASAGPLLIRNGTFSDSTPFLFNDATIGNYVQIERLGGVADSHYIATPGATIISATDQRNTASGISWKFRITSTTRNAGFPVEMSVAKVLCTANVAKTIKIYTYRDNTNIQGKLLIKGLYLGIPVESSVSCAPTINTWVESGALTVTTTETCVVEVFFQVWDGVGTTNNFWIDDLTVT